ncbi:MAG: sensor histidine kinase [Rhodospirillales bacterium]|nr:sensor histidine kinase [Rhodospirillales bacterium]
MTGTAGSASPHRSPSRVGPIGASYTPRQRAEQLIALGRTALAAVALVAIWLDPSSPARYAQLTYALCVLYLVYAAFLATLVWLAQVSLARLGAVSHGLDLVIYTVLIYLSEGVASPFFAFFVFSLLGATLRWGWRGVLWTGLAAITAFIGAGLFAQTVLQDPDFELNRFIIRSAYLAMVAALLGYMSAYQGRLHGELSRLAAWPRNPPSERLIEHALRQTAAVLEAPRVLMLWEEAEEPWRYTASLVEGEHSWLREPPVEGAGMVSEILEGRSFLCLDCADPSAATLYVSDRGLEWWPGTPLHETLRERFAIKPVLGLALSGSRFRGHLLVLDKPDMTSDDLMLGEVLTRQVAADLEQFYLQGKLEQAAVSSERARVGRDLHDGVLQSLSGISLQLKAAQVLLGSDVDAARARLQEIEGLLAAEQRDLRFVVQGLRPVAFDPADVAASLTAHLRELGRRIEGHWNLRVELDVAVLPQPLSERLALDLYRIAQEALVNAARHGKARVARVTMAQRGDRVAVAVADDGRGFDFEGRLDLAALIRRQSGPRSLIERVVALGGELEVVSSGSGARIELSLPSAGPARRPEQGVERGADTDGR